MVNPSPLPVSPVPPNPQGNTPAKTGLILGLCAILGWLLPIVGVPLTITGIVFSAIGLNRATRVRAVRLRRSGA